MLLSSLFVSSKFHITNTTNFLWVLLVCLSGPEYTSVQLQLVDYILCVCSSLKMAQWSRAVSRQRPRQAPCLISGPRWSHSSLSPPLHLSTALNNDHYGRRKAPHVEFSLILLHYLPLQPPHLPLLSPLHVPSSLGCHTLHAVNDCHIISFIISFISCTSRSTHTSVRQESADFPPFWSSFFTLLPPSCRFKLSLFPPSVSLHTLRLTVALFPPSLPALRLLGPCLHPSFWLICFCLSFWMCTLDNPRSSLPSVSCTEMHPIYFIDFHQGRNVQTKDWLAAVGLAKTSRWVTQGGRDSLKLD